MRRIVLFFTSGFYSGYIPFASGTFGTAVAVALYWPAAGLNRLPSEGGRPLLYVALTIAIALLGTWGADYAEKVYGEKDSGKVVIDEIAGFFVTMFLVPWTWYWVAAGFFIFRLFDVLKPPPIDRLQKLKGGVGIMIDDLLAGVYGCIVLHAARLAFDRFA